MNRKNCRPGPTLFLSASILLAFALRAARLDLQPLWWDEGYSVFFATRDFATMVARTAIDIHPPLYYALLQAWMQFAGKSDVALRLLSVGIGVATVPVIYLLGSNLFDRRAGLIGAFLLAILPLQVYYSQEVRMYGLVTLLGLVSIVLQLRLLGRREERGTTNPASRPDGNSRANLSQAISPLRSNNLVSRPGALPWALYILVTAAALYAEYYSVFVLAAEIVVVILFRITRRESGPPTQRPSAESGSRKPSALSSPTATGPDGQSPHETRIRPWVTAWLTIILLYLPWLIYAGPKLYAYVATKVGIEQYSRLDPFTFLVQHLAAFSVGHLDEFPRLIWSTPVFVALAAAGVICAYGNPVALSVRGKKDSASALEADRVLTTKIVLIYLFVPLICGWLVNLVYPFHPIRYERLLLIAAPPFYLLIARGLAALLNRRMRLAGVAIAAIVLISAASLFDFYTVPRYPDEDYRPLIREMGLMARHGDIVLAPYPWQIGYIESYYVGPSLQIIEVPSDEWISRPRTMDSALSSIRASNTREWLLAYQTKGRILEDQIANYFAGDYLFADDWFGNTRLEYFARGTDPPVNESAFVFAPDLKLDSFGAGTGPITAGADFVPVRLHWEARSNAYSYSLRLVNQAGEKRVQQDEPIAAGNFVERLGVFVPQEVTGGEYELIMVVYLRADSSPLSLPDGSHEFPLAHIVVNSR